MNELNPVKKSSDIIEKGSKIVDSLTKANSTNVGAISTITCGMFGVVKEAMKYDDNTKSIENAIDGNLKIVQDETCSDEIRCNANNNIAKILSEQEKSKRVKAFINAGLALSCLGIGVVIIKNIKIL